MLLALADELREAMAELRLRGSPPTRCAMFLNAGIQRPAASMSWRSIVACFRPSLTAAARTAITGKASPIPVATY
jgi:hypothetical protein